MKRLLWLLKITRHYYRLFGMAETLHKIATFLTDNEKKKALNSDAFVNQLIHEKFQKKYVIYPETDYFILDSHVNNKSRKLPFIPDERHKCNEKCKKFIEPELVIIIPTIGRSSYLHKQIEILSNEIQKNEFSAEIHVSVDSNISDSEKLFLTELESLAICHRLIWKWQTKVTGFANQVNDLVISTKSPWIMIMNDDVMPLENFLSNLINKKDLFPSVKLFSPLILNPDFSIQEAGSLLTSNGHTEWLFRGFPHDSFENIGEVKVPNISAVCWLIEREIFLNLELFKPILGQMYYEDTLFISKLRKYTEILLIPEAKIVHYLSQSSKGYAKLISAEIIGDYFRDSLDLQEKIEIESSQAKIMALYLPQYHRNELNDLHWGVGYTEWTSASNSKPVIKDQVQPLIPSELGFYDLSNPSVIKKQSQLAAQYGISAFNVMTYWFNGRKLLDEPLEAFLQPNLHTKFMIFWANESWTKRWDGLGKEIIIEQKHSVEDSINFIREHARFLKSDNYLKINGRTPLFIYKASLLGDPATHLDSMRIEARKLGLGELLLGMMETYENSMARIDPRRDGFDIAVEYPPHAGLKTIDPTNLINKEFSGLVHSYDDLIDHYSNRKQEAFPVLHTACVAYDNTARLGARSTIFMGATLDKYYFWLRNILKKSILNKEFTDSWVMINAWNEWGESAILEPSINYGRDYLSATKVALDSVSGNRIELKHE